MQLWVATAGGVGYAPFAPGTAGSVVGVLLFALTWHAGGTIAVSGNGISVSRTFDSGGSVDFYATDSDGYPLSDGIYRYHLSLGSSALAADLQAMEQAQASGDDAAYSTLADYVQSATYNNISQNGQFRVVNGQVEEYNDAIAAAEETADFEARKAAQAKAALDNQ